jgi:hypothetical protein
LAGVARRNRRRRACLQSLVWLIRVGFVGNVFACLADHAKAVLDAEGEVASKQEGKRVKAYRKKQRQDE